MLTRERLSLSVAVSFATILVMASPANAVRVRFDNPEGPEHYDWAMPGLLGELYVSRSATDQFPDPMPVPDLFNLGTDAGLTTGSVFGVVGGLVQIEADGIRLAPLNPGQLIPTPGLVWQQVGRITAPEIPSLLPEGVESYFGVCFTLSDGVHFGWIGVVRNAAMLDAFAWGYETAPFVPIPAGVPEPTGLVLLVVGAVGMISHRRGAR